MESGKKPSDITWIEDIPADWEVKRLGFLFTFGKGLNITKEDLQDEGIPCVSYGEIHSKYGFEVNPTKNILRCVDKKYLKTGRDSLLVYGDFLFADTSEDIEGSGNFTYLNSKEETFAGYHTIIVRVIDKLDYRYIAYLFDSIQFRNQIRDKVWGIKVYSITKQILKNTKVILPSPKEQHAIAAFLDTQCSKVDSIITELEQQIEILKQYKTSLITETVTKGLNKNVPMKNNRINWIGKMPAHWEVKKIKYMLESNQETLKESTKADYTFRYIDIGSVDFDKGIINYEEMNFENSPSRARRIVKKGDTIISTVRTYLKAIVRIKEDNDIIVSTGFTVLSPKNNNPCFIEYYCKSDIFCSEIEKLSYGIAYPAINESVLISIKMLLPPVEEQKAIAAYLDTQCKEITNIITEKQQSIDTMKEYKKSLIYEYVTGKKRIKGYK
jgi:type I restriction enzyme S subunit